MEGFLLTVYFFFLIKLSLFFQIFGSEWSYGYCEKGSGVYSSCPALHPMFSYRESAEMGTTLLDEQQVNRILAKLSKVWDGRSYDMLSRNCNHFCDALCQCLGVGKIPGEFLRFCRFSFSFFWDSKFWYRLFFSLGEQVCFCG